MLERDPIGKFPQMEVVLIILIINIQNIGSSHLSRREHVALEEEFGINS